MEVRKVADGELIGSPHTVIDSFAQQNQNRTIPMEHTPLPKPRQVQTNPTRHPKTLRQRR